MPNIEMLRRTLRAVQAADKVGAWNQKEWSSWTGCGTAYCFAGHALLLDDWRLAQDSYDYFVKGDWRGSAHFAAMEVLDLTCFQAKHLFASDNTLDDLARIVDELCREDPPA